MGVIVDRRERVILEVQDNASSEMVRFAATVALARQELDALSNQNVSVSVDSAQITAAIAQAQALRAELERVSRTNGTPGTSPTSGAAAAASGRRAAQQYGGAFDRELRGRIDRALRDLPPARVGVNLTGEELELNRLRAELEALSKLEIGVDIDAASAELSMDRVRVQLAALNGSTADVQVRADTAAAMAALAAVEARAARASGAGSGGGSGGTAAITRDANGASSSINQLTGRLGLLADGFLTLGPGLVPIAAVGVQAIGGLAAAATAAAVAGASAVVAFQGLGDAVTAVSEYQLDPTVAGLEKAQEAMAKLGPDAQRFVMEFQKFRPVLGDIKDAAAAGWFPGLTESLDGFAKLGPQIEDIFFKAGEAGGFIVDGAADSLASDRWAPFMDFLEREVPTAMGSLAQIMGDLGHGAAEMFMAFDPGNDSFLSWLEGVADGFDQWASSARGASAIEDILSYAKTNGPAVGELFSSLVGTLAALVKAAAPIGAVVLPGLTAISDAVRLIADSDMATPILAAVAAMRVFSRLQAGVVAASARPGGVLGGGAAPIMVRDPNAVGTGPMTQSQAAFVAAQNRQARDQARAAQRAAAGRAGVQGAALIGMVALSSSGLTKDMEGANAASMALLGTMVAPGWGTAAGAIVGGFMDIAGANDKLVDSFGKTSSALESGDFALISQSLATSMEELDAYKADLGSVGWSPIDQGQSLLSLGKGIFGDSDIEKAEKEYAALEEQQRSSQEAAAGLGEAFGMSIGPLDGSARSAAELQAALEAAKPAMDALSLSQEDLFNAQRQQELIGKGGMTGVAIEAALGSSRPGDDLAAEIADQARYMDSAQGKADNYTAALGALVREEGTAAERARGLNDALNALIDPANNAEAALDRYRQALKDISELNAKGGFTARTEVGRTNRAQTRDFADSVKERLATMVEAGRTEEDVAGALGRTREQFVKSGVAAGFSAEQMRKRATAIGLTPKLVETTFRELGVSKMDRAVTSLRDKFRDLPRSVKTEIRESGAIPTRARAMELIEKLNLVGKPRKALLSLVAEGEGNIAAAKRLMDSVNNKTVTLTTYQRTFKSGPQPGADGGTMGAHGLHFDGGGTVPGMRYPYGDKTPTMLAPGEEVISNRNGQADRYRTILKAINDGAQFRGYANGGTVDTVTPIGGSVGQNADDTVRGLKAMRKALEESTDALAKERDQRRSLIDTVKSNFKTDPFAKSDNIWASGGGSPISALQGDIADLTKFQTLIKRLDKRGLNGNALAEADTLEEAQMLASMSGAELRRYEQLYNRRERLSTSAGGAYANAVGAKSSDIRELQNEVKRLRRDIKAEEKKNRDNRDDNTTRAAGAAGAAARSAAQRRRRDRVT